MYYERLSDSKHSITLYGRRKPVLVPILLVLYDSRCLIGQQP